MAALEQLESAITLWFNEIYPLSVLVLASNAEDCLHAIGKRIGKPSIWADGMEKFPALSRERSRYIQDFAKHGEKDLDETARYNVKTGDMVLFLAIDCCRHIYGKVTPLMALFSARFFFENPATITESLQAQILKDLSVYDLERIRRKEFFQDIQPLLAQWATDPQFLCWQFRLYVIFIQESPLISVV